MSTPIQISLPIQIDTQILIYDDKTGELLRDEKNAVHSQNMARVIARGLANETNHFFKRIAFGNGGTFRDAAGNLVFNPPNDGRDGSWESRLYNETYSEIIDDSDVNYGTDPGSSESGNIRPGGGAIQDINDGGGVVSQEVGTKSNIICTVYLTPDEPSGQMEAPYGPDVVKNPDDRCFQFDELGIYSPGAPATATYGYTSIDVGNGTSESLTVLSPNTDYPITVSVNETLRMGVLRTPSGGSGPNHTFTYGDVCEGINTGQWIESGDLDASELHVYITDRSGGAYPSIIGQQSYGLLMFRSKTLGAGSSVELLGCGTPGTFFNVLTGGNCINVGQMGAIGESAGVANNPNDPNTERERLLTHLVFNPLLKHKGIGYKIVYILTVSVAKTSDSKVVLPPIINPPMD